MLLKISVLDGWDFIEVTEEEMEATQEEANRLFEQATDEALRELEVVHVEHEMNDECPW